MHKLPQIGIGTKAQSPLIVDMNKVWECFESQKMALTLKNMVFGTFVVKLQVIWFIYIWEREKTHIAEFNVMLRPEGNFRIKIKHIILIIERKLHGTMTVCKFSSKNMNANKPKALN